MNCTGVASTNSHFPQLIQGSAGSGTQDTRLMPAARAMKAPARNSASASTPPITKPTRRRMTRNSRSGFWKVCRQVWLQK